MIPGSTSKLTESTVPAGPTISVKTDIVLVPGGQTVNNIIPNFGGGFGGFVFIYPLQSNLILGTSGNIAGGGTFSTVQLLVYVKSKGKWYIVGV